MVIAGWEEKEEEERRGLTDSWVELKGRRWMGMKAPPSLPEHVVLQG